MLECPGREHICVHVRKREIEEERLVLVIVDEVSGVERERRGEVVVAVRLLHQRGVVVKETQQGVGEWFVDLSGK